MLVAACLREMGCRVETPEINTHTHIHRETDTHTHRHRETDVHIVCIKYNTRLIFVPFYWTKINYCRLSKFMSCHIKTTGFVMISKLFNMFKYFPSCSILRWSLSIKLLQTIWHITKLIHKINQKSIVLIQVVSVWARKQDLSVHSRIKCLVVSDVVIVMVTLTYKIKI